MVSVFVVKLVNFMIVSFAEMLNRQEDKYFFADRTNGRTTGTMLLVQCCVCCLSSSSMTLCIVAKRCVLDQKLLLRAYRKSYMRNRLVPK